MATKAISKMNKKELYTLCQEQKAEIQKLKEENEKLKEENEYAQKIIDNKEISWKTNKRLKEENERLEKQNG